uniref:Uncharacterized protein n=1 Tax=Anguilla anguilla TaxID=7936 RepID=A0A0E9UC46_ANGAN
MNCVSYLHLTYLRSASGLNSVSLKSNLIQMYGEDRIPTYQIVSKRYLPRSLLVCISMGRF